MWMFIGVYREWQYHSLINVMVFIEQWFKLQNLSVPLLFMHSHAAEWSHPHLVSGTIPMFTTMIRGKLFNCGCEGCFHVALAIISLHTVVVALTGKSEN